MLAKGKNARLARGAVIRKGRVGSQFNTQISPIAYLKVVRDEAYSYSLAQHYAGGHTFALASGSPALPTGLSLAADGTLSGTATTANMNADFVMRATNTISGLTADVLVPISVAQRPGAFAAPTLTELSSTSLRVTKPSNPANTPAVTSVILLHGATSPLTLANGTAVFNAYPSGETFDITGLQAGTTRYVTLKARTFWKDGEPLDADGYSPNVANLTLSGANTPPSYTAPPTITPASAPAGSTFTLNPGAVSGQPTPANTLIGLTQNGVDRLAQVSGNSFTSTAQGPLVATWQATNGVSPNATAQAAATITAAAQVPGVMAAPGLAVVSASQIDATVAAAPADGGSAITSYEMRYSLDQVNWTTITGLTAGETRSIIGLLASTAYYFQNAARNAVGLGPWSASASATTNAASGTTIQFGQFTASGAGAKAISEADGTYGQFTVTAGVITPNTSPLAVGTVVIGSTNVTVVANEYSVASLAEFTAARTAMGAGGGRTIRFRTGTYAVGTGYVIASVSYAALVSITCEAGTKLTGTVVLSNPSNVRLAGFEIDCTDTAAVNIVDLIGPCTGCQVWDNYLHGIPRDPLGDYYTLNYYNPDHGIGTSATVGGQYLNGCSILRNRIEHVKEGIVLLIGGAADYDVWDNDIGYTYSDANKIAIYQSPALTANKRWRRNWWYMMIGRQDDNGGLGSPHSDMWQNVRTAVSDGADITNFEFTQNVWLNTRYSRGYNIQGVFAASDGGNRPRFVNPNISGNICMSDTAHFISLLVSGGVMAHNVLITTTAPKGGQPLGKYTGQGAFNLTVNGNSPLLLRNITNVAPTISGGTATQTDNLLLGSDYATYAVATVFDGADLEQTTWAGIQTAYDIKAGGPADTGFGRGAIGTGIGTYGARRDPSGWTYNAAYEQVTPSTLTTISISEPQLPVYDCNPFFGGQAAVSFTVTHDTGPGDTLQYRIINGDTAAVIQDWTDFAATTGSTTLTINRGPSFTPLKIAVRGKVQTAVTATQATKWRAGYIVAVMGQSLAIRPLTHNFALSLTPSAEKVWVLYNNANGTLASGPILTDGAAVLGPRRMAELVNAYGDGPVCLVDITEAGTGRDETSDANETTNRSWATTMQAPVDYIRTRGSDFCMVLDHWFTNDASVWTKMARWCAPFYLRQQIDGLLATADGTGVQPYSGASVQVVAAKTYTPVHFLFDLTGGGQGLFNAGRTRWMPWFGMSAYAATATMFEPGSDTTSSGNNAWAAPDRQKGTVRWELEQMAEATAAYLPISLRSLPGWSGQASFGGHLAMPEGTHVSDTADGEGLVAPYMMAAILRALGKLGRAEPRITSVTWAASGANAVVRISLPNGGNLSTAYIQQQAGAYAGSFEGTNWIAPTVLPETTDPFLHSVQGFTIKRASDGLRRKSGFTATITNTGTGTGASRYGEITITPTTAFANGDSIAFGLYDGFNTLTLSATNAARPHYHLPLETRAHVSGTGYGWPVVRESATLAFATAAGINGAATAPSAFVAGNWTLTDPATDGDLTVTITALPSDGGSALTAIQYQVDGGNWISFGAATVGTYTISGLSNNVSHAVVLRAVNAVGASAASDTKNATPTADTVAPTLTSPTDVANGANAMTGSVSTNEATGTLYWVVTTSATAPSAAQVKAGQNHLGAAAPASGSQAVTTTGVQAMSDNGLAAGTAYFTHFMHEDGAANQSAVSSADGFTTAAAATTFFTHATYFVAPANVPGSTTRLTFKAKIKMPTHPSAIKFLFTQESTGCDLTTLATNKWKMVAENSGGTQIMNVSSNVTLPTAGAWVEIEYDVDQTAGTATVKHDGVTVLSASPTSGGTYQTNREVSFLAGTTGASIWPDCEVEYLEVYYNGSLHKRIDASGGIAAINADVWQKGGDVT